MKTSAETKLLIASVKEVFRNSGKYGLACSEGNTEALAETADFRQWLLQQTEQHFADPIEEAIGNGIPANPMSLANYVLWFYSDNHFTTIEFQEI